MPTSSQTLPLCIDEVQHYFRAMGGANQYDSFMNWHIPAFVLLILKNDVGSELLPYRAWHGTEKLQAFVRSKVEAATPNKEDIQEFIEDVTSRIPKFKDEREIGGWLNFLESLNVVSNDD